MPYDRGVCKAVDAHLSCERRAFESRRSIKPLGPTSNEHDLTLTFHITFYEIYLHGSKNGVEDLWKVGKLYNDPKKRWFRECACTVSDLFFDGVESSISIQLLCSEISSRF